MPFSALFKDGSLTVTRRLWRDGMQRACIRLAGVLGFNRQPVPHLCHVDQNGLNSRIWRAAAICRHSTASRRHSTGAIIAARQDVGRLAPTPNHTTTIAVFPEVACLQTRKIFTSLSRIPGRRRGLLDSKIIVFGGVATLPSLPNLRTPPRLLGGVHFVRAGPGSQSDA
jgi:hypothetical protein